jgi:MATE family multidrug resistance protein
VLLPIAVLLPVVFDRLGHEPRLVELETVYARVLLAGAAVLLAGRSMHQFFFGLHRPKVVTVSAIVANVVNVGANYVLIFGEAGIPAWGLPGVPGVPALGVLGAALGTVLGTIVELALPLAVFLSGPLHRELGTRSSWRPHGPSMRGIVRLGWPASVQWGNELACFAVLMTVLTAKFGPNHMTAGWIVLGYMHLSFMPAAGLGVAITSIVGRYIGAGEPDTAVHRARIGLVMATVYMGICAAVFLTFRRPLIAAFVGADTPAAQAAEIVTIGSRIMICAVVFQVFDAIGLAYSGAMRGAGDTVWPGVATIVLSWTFIVGGGGLMVRGAPQLESLGPWIAAAVYIVLLGIAFAWRFESGAWRRIALVRPVPAPTPEAVA